VGYLSIRGLVMQGLVQAYLIGSPISTGWRGLKTLLKALYSDPCDTFTKLASTDEIEEILVLLNSGLNRGGLGIGLALDYISEAVSTAELEMIFDVPGVDKCQYLFMCAVALTVTLRDCEKSSLRLSGRMLVSIFGI
jgi:hypothetical protein